ncbi:aldehyde dehydrogenase (NADP(+)) [Marinilongibacter aquaticus]|uniref:aldehyde dehydrogenase (NADP(+)) n=1 Tax=Marinilongibacter aquaticus TaxID=2975157 RepID=UPI0021BDC784|nr:aldehyde dehydrogenase (NADP(+)) [Marinilongibacter aquaticus]UBM57783.1 aldehyde dehydrogenase (NADP(+)) [Marinilongibacter aquaticus]
MELKGQQIIGQSRSSEGTVAEQSLNPATGEKLAPLYFQATAGELKKALGLAEQAFRIYRNTSGKDKGTFLRQIAEEIEKLGDELIARYTVESGLPAGRAMGERGRTCGQLRLFAELVEEGSWLNAKIDTALPDRTPLPRADIRSMERPLGPVAVFGASNFPLAFSVAGGDTVSALAAGCPVIFKAHPAHMGTSELVGLAIQKAAELCGMPAGVFSMLYADVEVSQALVQAPEIKAVGFTGSYRVGKSLFDLAARREEPIPVYSEMGSVNPVFVLPKTLAKDPQKFAGAYLASVTLGVGQFCTNPGILVTEANADFYQELESKTKGNPGGNMLTPGIQKAYEDGLSKQKLAAATLASGLVSDGHTGVAATILKTDYENFTSQGSLHEEVFGPSSLIVEGKSKAEFMAIAENLEGHLTATVYGDEEELQEYAELLSLLELKVGRVIINGFPTGVEVCHAMVHGGPFPATTDSRSTSVGTGAITRFTRPVCYQDMPDALLPDALKSVNPLGIFRLLNGKRGVQ